MLFLSRLWPRRVTTTKPVNISPDGIHLIKHFEECSLVAYQDEGGRWTIGWGETNGVAAGMVWTQPQADQKLADRLAELCRQMTAIFPGIPIRQYEFDAFVCFAYNEGFTAFHESTMLKRFLTGQDCTSEFYRWVMVNGKVSAGLGLRRTAERLLFKSKDWRYVL